MIAKKYFINLKKNNFLLLLTCALITSCLFANTSDFFKIGKIEICGLEKYNQDSIIEKLPIRTGDKYIQKATTKAIIDRLLSLELFSEKILVYGKKNSQTIDLKIAVEEKKVLSEYVINGYSSLTFSALSTAAKFKETKLVSSHDIAILKAKLIKKYQQSGIFDTEVDVVVEEEAEFPDAVKLIFNIREGVKKPVTEVKLVGCNNVLPSQLKEALLTKKDWLLSKLDGSGRLNKEMIEYDKASISKFYANKGFYNAKVKDVIIDSDEQNNQTVSFVIDEGNCYTVRFIDVPADEEFSMDLLKKAVLLKRGQTFSLKKMMSSLDRLKDVFGSKGYLFCNVYPEVKCVDENGQHFIDIKFFAEKGEPYRINEIKITGNTKTREYVIRNRALRVYDGGLATKVGLDASLNSISALGYFDRNHLDWKKTRVGEGLVDLELNLKEVKTGNGSLSVSGGPQRGSSTAQINIAGELSKRNLLGRGWDAGIMGRYDGREINAIGFDFFNPALFDQDLCFGVKAKMNKLRYSEYDRFFEKNPTEKTVSLGCSFGKYFLPDTYCLKASVDFGVESISFSKKVLNEKLANNRFAKVLNAELRDGGYNWLGLRITKDTLNHPMYPSTGWRVELDNRVALPMFSDNYSMLRTELTGYYFIPLLGKERLVLSLSAKLGIVKQLFENAPIPFKELYMFGGLDSMRGFRWGEAGPADRRTNAPLGATKMLLGKVELITPMAGGNEFDTNVPRVYLFYDIGTAWGAPDFKETIAETKELKSIYRKSDLIKNDFNLRQSIGVGLKTLAPQPFCVEFGYKLDRAPKSKERSGEWHLKFNVPFDT